MFRINLTMLELQTITPAEEGYMGCIITPRNGYVFEYLATSDDDLRLLAVHGDKCHIGAQYRGNWPKNIHLQVLRTSGLNSERVDFKDSIPQVYTSELMNFSKGLMVGFYIGSLKSVDEKLLASIYALTNSFATPHNIAALSGCKYDAIVRAGTSVVSSGLVSKLQNGRGITFSLSNVAHLKIMGIDTQMLRGIVH